MRERERSLTLWYLVRPCQRFLKRSRVSALATRRRSPAVVTWEMAIFTCLCISKTMSPAENSCASSSCSALVSAVRSRESTELALTNVRTIWPSRSRGHSTSSDALSRCLIRKVYSIPIAFLTTERCPADRVVETTRADIAEEDQAVLYDVRSRLRDETGRCGLGSLWPEPQSNFSPIRECLASGRSEMQLG